jgi:hypothetical protein
MAEVWETRLPPTEKLVLLAYADHANDEGLCYPGATHISVKCTLSLRSAKRVGAWLRERGYLVLIAAGGGILRTVVKVVPNPHPLCTSVAHDTGDKLGIETPPPSVTSGQAPVSPAVGITIREPSSKRIIKTAPSDTDFERFWAVYPRKVGKAAALKAWNRKNLSTTDTDNLIKDINYRVVHDDAWKERRFVIHATTYLNQERWYDEVQKYEAPKRNLSAVERVGIATRKRDAELSAQTDERTLASYDGNLRPQVEQPIR